MRYRMRPSVDVLAAILAAADADLLVLVREAVADAGGLAAGRTHEGDVVDAQRSLRLEHAAGRHLRAARALDRLRTRVLVHDVELLDDQATLGGDDFHHRTGASDILAR